MIYPAQGKIWINTKKGIKAKRAYRVLNITFGAEKLFMVTISLYAPRGRRRTDSQVLDLSRIQTRRPHKYSLRALVYFLSRDTYYHLTVQE